jgi:hypothetical protein
MNIIELHPPGSCTFGDNYLDKFIDIDSWYTGYDLLNLSTSTSLNAAIRGAIHDSRIAQLNNHRRLK